MSETANFAIKLKGQVRRVGVNDEFEQAAADAAGILARARIVHDTERQMYVVSVSDVVVLEVEERVVRRQSFPLNEYIARELRGLLCVSCGGCLIAGEQGICSRCEARQVQSLLALRSRFTPTT